MTNLITPKQFLNAFETLWNEDASNNSKRKQAFRHKEPWNEYMLGSEPPGFLRRVADKLRQDVNRLECYGELYTLDLVYVSGEDLYRKDLYYPSLLSVIIEHEHNLETVEEEMWKLIFWRSPLKVLISYDWNDDEKTTENRKNKLSGKLKKLSKMLDSANTAYPETKGTEYLFIIGNRDNVRSDIRWRWADTSLKVNSFAESDINLPE